MGLDVVELVMEVEEKFGIKIEDEEYAFVPRVQDLHDLIIRKRRRPSGTAHGNERRESPPCFSLVAFVRLRRALMERFDVPRNLVRPATNLDEVFPADERRTRWTDLSRELQLELPALSRPSWLRWLLGVGWSPIVALLLSFASLGVISGAGVLVGLIATVTLILVSWHLTGPLAVSLEPAQCTVGGLTKEILALNYRFFADRYPVERDGNVMTKLIGIISETLGIPVDEIKPEMSFIDDLQCG